MKISILWLKVIFSILLLSACSGSEKPLSMKQSIISYMDENDYVGLSIYASKEGREVYFESFGYSDLNKDTGFDKSGFVSLGSNAKFLTATSILLLVDRGLVNLDDEISTHFPFQLGWLQDIKIYDMLCHVSSIPNVFGGEGFEEYRWQKVNSQRELVDAAVASEPKLKNLSEYSYNNTAYLILGMVVEHLSNQSLGDFYRENIFKPLEIEGAYYMGDSFYSPSLIPSFESDSEDYSQPVEYRVVGGAGALGGDIKSYSKLFRGVLRGSILSDESKKMMITPCIYPDGSVVEDKRKNRKIGLGVGILDIEGKTVLASGGALNGYVSAIYYFKESDLSVAVIGNTWVPLEPLLEEMFREKYHETF